MVIRERLSKDIMEMAEEVEKLEGNKWRDIQHSRGHPKKLYSEGISPDVD
jgi:hypothetical protein